MSCILLPCSPQELLQTGGQAPVLAVSVGGQRVLFRKWPEIILLPLLTWLADWERSANAKAVGKAEHSTDQRFVKSVPNTGQLDFPGSCSYCPWTFL